MRCEGLEGRGEGKEKVIEKNYLKIADGIKKKKGKKHCF